MRIFSMLAAALSMSSSFGNIQPVMVHPFRGATPSRRYRNKSTWEYEGCPQSENSDGLPRSYPGAKMARKAMQKALAVKHPRGLRLDGKTV